LLQRLDAVQLVQLEQLEQLEQPERQVGESRVQMQPV
jgi:hypothetical protein